MPAGTHAPIDQKFSQYKDDDLSLWLSKCPFQIMRNSFVHWHQIYQTFLKRECGKPKRKSKHDGGSIHLTKEIFRFERCKDGITRLFIGTKTNNISYLLIKKHGPYQMPKSIYIKKQHRDYWVSFCYEDDLDESILLTQEESLKQLQGVSRDFLENHTVGIDRGIVRPIQAGSEVFDLISEQKKNKAGRERYLKRYQRRLAKQKKSSKRALSNKEKDSWLSPENSQHPQKFLPENKAKNCR